MLGDLVAKDPDMGVQGRLNLALATFLPPKSASTIMCWMGAKGFDLARGGTGTATCARGAQDRLGREPDWRRTPRRPTRTPTATIA